MALRVSTEYHDYICEFQLNKEMQFENKAKIIRDDFDSIWFTFWIEW